MTEKQRITDAIVDARKRGIRHLTVPVDMLAVALGIDAPASEAPTPDAPSRRAKRKPTTTPPAE